MNNVMNSTHSLSQYWDVLSRFIIPLGFGIPSGILKAQTHKINWQIILLLYFISDLMLACVFEPILILFIKYGKRNTKLAQISEILKLSIQQTLSYYGNSNSILALVMIAFGVDPMTGRTIAVTMGHGFVTGWIIAITGDMFYFALLMISTLWLNNILGDGKLTTIIILFIMIAAPQLLKKIKHKLNLK